jgi:hypothetical protein
MKLVKSIVILKRKELGQPVIDLVLLVKHPEDCDPVERLNAALREFLKSAPGQKVLNDFSWNDLIRRMQGWDWSTQALYIEEAPMWTVVDRDESLQHAANWIA